MNLTPLFGPGGNSQAFYDDGHKSSKEAPAWVAAQGLDAYEFEAGNGLTAGEDTLSAIGLAAEESGIRMSFHTPYFISLSGTDPEKRLKSIEYISQSLRAAELLRAEIIVVHTGSAAKISREEAMNLSADTLWRVLEEVPDNGVRIGLETMGKLNQLGTLSEVLELCHISPRFAPVVDFGHLNARACGGEGSFRTKEDYMRVFAEIACSLGDSYAINLHTHFSKIEYTNAGEKRHLTFEDERFGPAFEPLMEAVAALRVCPTVICESAGTMARDALAMKQYYQKLSLGN